MAQQAQVTEEQARAVAEESREAGWEKPSFAKELFLGRFPLELIHPFPRPSADETARTEEFLGKLREFLQNVDGSVIERDSQIPDEYVKGLAELGCFGMKIPSEYGGLNMSQVAYNRALMMVATVHPSLGALLSAHQSIGYRNHSSLPGPRNRSGGSCRDVRPGQFRRFCSPNRTSARTRHGWRRPRHRLTTGRPTNSTG
ncbi:acyl-CoA dehydrogenase, N-terminal domain protein [Mycobacterium xenopi 4042]|uniref:Acyl-CoA dehydrogenase, N-terminal domain protein n=1 Tax=Mycobacterium xenopi 4042 TaxID=1299334 RepID=X8AGS3_MYCXE|nr:acyl-CoA dehydrogenase, N-terminal domain protein [Mycobacterium xenopi 4042]